ncbi:hypothetical protein N7466_002903 [Penicillium verhagenii]|uniref:uncharacterized protein n=1 Tax=Penicillium verhagenii TaxID=1562060 RepID=UPI002545863D|nr:uncharacterized protein N7466_002903 [Penicillium verhagenii]KAJ5939769.1 hypothetical protein N7466_002903 [Penicillium verhagenii]
MTIPADITAAKAAGRIPDGISLSYLAESRDHSAIVGILFMVCLTSILMILRLYARLFLVKKVGVDDCLAILTWMIYISFVALSIVLIHLGSGRHIDYIQYVLSLATVRETEVLDFVAHILYTTALFLCRLSGLAFYYRLTARTSKLNKSILFAAPFLFAAFLPQIFLLIFHCQPVTGLWPYSWQPGVDDYTCLSWGLVYSVNSGLSLACDVMMFVLPAILIKQLHVSLKNKIKLSIVMFPGVLSVFLPQYTPISFWNLKLTISDSVIIISAIRVWLVVKGQWATDGSWAYNPMLCVENAEIAGTLVALSVPALKPVFGNIFSQLTEYTGSRTRSRSRSAGDRLRSQSKPASALGSSAVRDDKRLLNWSKIGQDEYEMMPSEVSVVRNPSNATKIPGIHVTNEINITHGEERRSPSPQSSIRPSSHET